MWYFEMAIGLLSQEHESCYAVFKIIQTGNNPSKLFFFFFLLHKTYLYDLLNDPLVTIAVNHK